MEQAKINQLRRALIQGEKSGPAQAFDFEAFRASKAKPDTHPVPNE